MKREIWKVIPGYHLYEVSNLGSVRRRAGYYCKQTRKLNLRIHPQDYREVILTQDGVSRTKLVHRLVLLSFIGESPLQCNHKNGIKSDNRLVNLEYVTPSENSQHAYSTGLSRNAAGEDSHLSKLTAQEVLQIRSAVGTQAQIAKQFGISQTQVGRIKRFERWKHV